MGEYLKKLTVATTISLLILGTVESDKALGSALFLGKYGSKLNFKEFLSSLQNNIKENSAIARRSASANRDIISQNSASKQKIQSLDRQLSNKLDTLSKAEILNQKINNNYQAFLENYKVATGNLEQPKSSALDVDEFKKYTNPDAINQDIRDRYQGLVEPETEELNSGVLDSVQVQDSLALLQSQGWIEADPTQQQKTIGFPLSLTIAISLLIAWRSSSIMLPLLKVLGYSIDQGIGEELREKYGSPKVPDNAIELHDRTFKKVRSLAFKSEKVASEKFGNEEFMLYVRLKKQVEQGIKEYKAISESIKLLEVAISAQSSFLKIESTELRFRSRKQQEFYNFVTDNLEDDIDKEEFRNKIKRKLAEIMPLLNSEQGRASLQSYLKEINTISQHDLGLKLLALFKKYQLEDFAILRTIADIVKRLEAEDLLNHNNLVVLILEHLNVFEKLAPIIGIAEEDNSPETYAKMMQYMGLISRHEAAYGEFSKLIKLLKEWHKPYKSLVTIRETYPAEKYRLPPEFSKDIPGVTIFKKYEKYLDFIK